MREPMSLMEFLQELQGDAGLRDHFRADPQGTLTEHGLAHLGPADVHDALLLVEDTRTADFDPGFGTGAGQLAPAETGHAAVMDDLGAYFADDEDDLFGSGSVAGPIGEQDESAYDSLFDLGPAGHEDDDAFGTGHAGPGHLPDADL